MSTIESWNYDHNGIADTHVHDSHPDTNYNGEYNVIAGYDPVEKDNCRIWLKLDLSFIPRHAQIESAGFVMGTFIHGESSYGTTTYEIQRCSDNSWDDSTITWNNAPNASMTGSATNLFSTTSPMGQDLYYYDLMADAQAAIGGDGYLSYRIKNTNEGLDDSYIMMYTEEEYNDLGLRPYPNINFSIGFSYNNGNFFQSFN